MTGSLFNVESQNQLLKVIFLVEDIICQIKKSLVLIKTALSLQGEDVGTGLLTYPLLMASDILLYQVRFY
jgi:tryptophanyl-tRNA synthetase